MIKSRTVLLIPGIFDFGWSMRRMEKALTLSGFSAHYIHLKYNSGWYGLEHLSEQLSGWAKALTEEGSSFALVGFSMGGIVARYYLQELGGLDRVHKLICIASPHFGSYWASFLPYKGGRQLRVGSNFLQNLNGKIDRLSRTSPVSIWTRYDLMILPHSSARLPIGKNFEIPVKLHRWMPSDARVISLVCKELAAALD